MNKSHAGMLRKRVTPFLGIVILGGLLSLYFARNTLAKRAIEHGAEYAFGVPASVGSVNVDVRDPSVHIRNLNTANPTKFSDRSFFKIDYSHASLDGRTILSKRVTISEMTFSGIALFLEMKGSKSNVAVILDNLKQIQDNGSPTKHQNGTDAEFVIEELNVYDIGIYTHVMPISGLTATGELVIDHIRLTDIGTNGTGVRMEEILGITLQAILSSTVQMRSSGLPVDLITEISGSLNDLQALQTRGISLTTETAERMKAVVGSTMKGVKDSMPNPDELREDIEQIGDDILKTVERNDSSDSM